MNVGFDPGSDEMRVLFRRGRQLIARHCRSAYAILPDEPQHRQLLADSRLPFGTCEKHLVLLGDAISAFDIPLRGPRWPLLPAEKTESLDTLAREILVAELESLIPASPIPESLCGISLPFDSVGRHKASPASTRDFLLQWVQLRGYTPLEISPARALILAELSQSGLTGLAVTFGAAYCTYSLCYRGDELVTGYVARGGRWIDEQMNRQLPIVGVDSQGLTRLDPDKISAWKVSKLRSLVKPKNPAESVLRDLYRTLLRDVFEQLFDDLFDAKLPRPFPPVSLLVGGGLSRISGFREALEELWLRPRLPLEINDVVSANVSPLTTARGCLIHAGLASTSERNAA